MPGFARFLLGIIALFVFLTMVGMSGSSDFSESDKEGMLIVMLVSISIFFLCMWSVWNPERIHGPKPKSRQELMRQMLVAEIEAALEKWEITRKHHLIPSYVRESIAFKNMETLASWRHQMNTIDELTWYTIRLHSSFSDVINILTKGRHAG